MKTESTLTSNRMETLSKYFPAGRLLATLFAGMLFLLVFGQPATTSDTELQDAPQEVVLTGDEDKNNPPPPPAGARRMHVQVFLQGYYLGSGLMRQAHESKDGVIEPRYSLPTSDMVTIRLHSGDDYSNVLQTVNEVSPGAGEGLIRLKTNGKVLEFPIYDHIDQEVWVSVRHRNHLETVYYQKIDLGHEVQVELYTVDFTTEVPDGSGGMRDPSYGQNQHQFSDGKFGIFAGDVNQDGVLTFADFVAITNDVRSGATGYKSTDANGDGVLTFADFVMATNNVRRGVERVLPSRKAMP